MMYLICFVVVVVFFFFLFPAALLSLNSRVSRTEGKLADPIALLRIIYDIYHILCED